MTHYSAIGPMELLESRTLLALYGPDVSFANGGLANVQGNVVLDVLPDNKILAVGYKSLPSRFFDDDIRYQSVATRLNADGTLDTTFGNDGAIDFGVGIVRAVRAGSRFYVLDPEEFEEAPTQLRAYNLNGQPETAFGGDGSVEDSGFALFAAADGGVYVRSTDALTKYKPDGTLDTAFADAGAFAIPEGTFVFVTTNGVLHLKAADGGGIDITRYELDGETVDT